MGGQNKKILITGVAGFIGSNLADRLIEKGYEVLGVDNLSQGLKEQVNNKVIFFPFDIRNKEIYSVFEGVDTVFHLAAKNCISDCEKDPVETASINVTGTVNVLEAAKQAGVRKVVYSESSAIYEGTQKFPTPEEGEERPVSFYADSKYASHFFLESFERNHRLMTTTLRYFNVYGPRQDYRRVDRPIMTEFIIQLLTGQIPILFGEGKRTKDYIYIDDIIDFHLLCLNDERTNGQVYNLGSGTETSYAEVLDLVQRLLGTKVGPELRPALVGGVLRTCADISKAKTLGWQPKIDLETGLLKSIKYIKQEVLPKL